MKNLKVYVKKGTFLLTTLIIASSFNGCVKKLNCDTNEKHAHYYITDNGFGTYRISENMTIGNLCNMDYANEITPITDEIRIMDKYNLYSFEENYNVISNRDNPYVEYEYYFTAVIGDTVVGKLGFIKSKPRLYPNIRLTGRICVANYKYCGYKVVKDEKGKEHLEKSEYVDDLQLLKEEYPYFKLADYKIITYGEPDFLNYEKIDGNVKSKE